MFKSNSQTIKLVLPWWQENKEELARVEVHDTGKPIWEARFDVEGCADAVEYFAGLASNIAGNTR